jgi:tetratricopeptide (TPR) repeat protein
LQQDQLVSKKHKHKIPPERPLPERIAKARREGRTQQALDLTRQLYKHEHNEAHQELLRQVTLERGQQLQAQGMLKDAAMVYTNALTLGGSVDYRAQVAQALAACGATTEAIAVIHEIPDTVTRRRILGSAVDAALVKGPAGKNQLPADLHAPFDLVLQAFAHSEAGRDEDARNALQSIGLQSPFLEWKLFLRGLLAYYANDDARALENWQRLDAHRTPAHLAAPLRLSVDATYRQAQPPATQQQLVRQFERMQGPSNVSAILQSMRQDMPHNNLAPAFRKAEQAVNLLKKDRPDLAARLGQCFYWAVIDRGQPEDIDRYLRAFGRPADDPNVHRLEALALEERGMWAESHKAWQNFINHVMHSPQTWPGDVGKYVQALVWARMAENAGPLRLKRKKSLNPFLDVLEGPRQPLKPDAEHCYQKAIELAPDRIESYLALFELYREGNELAKAQKFGQELLKRFPDHAATLEELGELFLETQDYKKAQEYFDKSLQANPLDRSLRGKLGHARQKWALELTLQGKHDEARKQYEQALKLWDGPKVSLLCQWAIAEIKAKNTQRGEELMAQANEEPNHRLACRYLWVCESIRAKLPPKQKKQFNDELKTVLTEEPKPAEVLVLLEVAAQQRQTHTETFRGQKSHEKTILKFLDQLHLQAFDESQLERLCAGLQGLQARKPWMDCLEYARRRFLKNPAFRLSWVDYYLTGPRPEDKTHLAREHLDQARRLIEAMPRGEQQQQLLDQLKQKEKIIAELTAGRMSMFDMMDRLFSGFGGFGDEDEDEEYWDDE